jgi:ATP-dependent Clp protease ATP-binding subunit ClpA
MSVQTSFEKIIREAAYKRLIIADGNVGDVYLNNDSFVNFTTRLDAGLNEKKLFDDIYIWDRVSGFEGGGIEKLAASQAESGVNCPVEGLDPNIFSGDAQTGMYKKPCDFYSVVCDNLLNDKQRVCFIVNYSNYLFASDQGLSDDDRENLTRLAKAVREQKVHRAKGGSVVIFVAPNISMIPVSLYQKNPDACVVTFSNPDRDERRKIIEYLSSTFRLKNDLDIDEQGKTNLIDGTDNLSAKEIIQLAQLSRTVGNKPSDDGNSAESKTDDMPSVDNLLSLYKYGKKDSPWEQVDAENVRNITEILGRRVKGQDEAIAKLRQVVIRAKTGLSGLQHSKSRNKPKGALFFAGPTGVGKTELAKSLAEFLFTDENACIRFDMSEYNHEQSDQKLIGAPPGYVGYEAGGQLTNLIKERPFCVLLFDEIEKAHPKILDKFLQILEDGRLTDNKGETVYFSECIIIFTSNIGANKVNPSMDYEAIQKTIFNEIRQKFETEINRPELLGRIGYGNIVVFNYINDKDVQKAIAETKIAPIVEFLHENKRINLEFSNKDVFFDYLLTASDAGKGGRDILNRLEDILVSQLADWLFDNDGYIYPYSVVHAEFDDKTGKFDFTTKK